jgi:glycosyltransferase involved in cell wall biosynthesis
MKVVHIVSGDLWAGAEAVVHQLVRGQLQSAADQVAVIALNEGEPTERFRAAGAVVHVLDEKRLGFMSILRQSRALLAALRPDIVHSHRYKENMIAALSSLLRPRWGKIATQHGLPELVGAKAKTRHRVLAHINFFLLKHAFQRVVVVTDDIRRLLLAGKKIESEILRVVRNGIDLPVASVPRSRKPVFTVGTAGRLFPVKDFLLFLEAAARMLECAGDLRFEIAGDGPEMARLQSFVQSRGLESRVGLLGHVDDMAEFYCRTDLYVNTSTHEGIPMSVLEAMAYGAPLVAPEVGGFPEIIQNGVHGFLIKERKAENFANACLKIIRNPELYREMSIQARMRIEQCFSASAMTESYWAVYGEVVESLRCRKTAALAP